MNTPFVFETENEGSDPEMESPYGSYETDFGENEFEDEVRDHRRSATPGTRPPAPRTMVRPGFRGPNVRPPSRPSFQPGGSGPYRPIGRSPYRPVSSQYRYPYRPIGTAIRPIWGGYRRPYDPRFRPQFGTPVGVRPGYYRPPFGRPWGRPFLDGVNRYYPPTDPGTPDGDGLPPQRPESLIRLIQSLLNKLAGSNIPVSGVMNGATLDAINQVAPEPPGPESAGTAVAPPPAPDQSTPAPPEPVPAPSGETEYFLGDNEFDNEFEAFDNEFETLNEEEELTPEDISQLQMALSQALGTQVEPDGRINFRTRRALRSFQQQSGLPGHGFLDRMTRRRLMPGGYGQRYRYGRRRPRGSFFETEADFENEQQKQVLVWYTNPLPASENGRFLAALATLEKLIYSSGNRRDWRFLCWTNKLRQSGTDDRVVKWSTICPAQTGAIGAAAIVGPCDLTMGSPIRQDTIEKSFRTVDDVERNGQSVGIFTYVKSDIVVAVEMTASPLESFRNLYNNVITATHKLALWADNPMGGSSAMPKAYVAIKDWIGRKQRDKNSLNNC